MSIKVRGILIISLMVSGVFFSAAISELFNVPGTSAWLILLMVVPALFGFAAAARLKCQECNFRLSKNFSVGALILLPFANERCPQCGEEL
jgi:hypothetical protein